LPTLTLRPNGDNARRLELDIFPASPTTHYTKINESVEDITNYVSCETVLIPDDVTKIDTYDLPDHTTEWGDINSVTIKAKAARTMGECYISLGMYLNGGVYFASPLLLDSSDTLYQYTWTVRPSDGLPFSWSDIDSLVTELLLRTITSSGGKGGVPGKAECYQLWVEIDYTETFTLDLLTVHSNLADILQVSGDLPLLYIQSNLNIQTFLSEVGTAGLLGVSSSILNGDLVFEDYHPCLASIFKTSPIGIQQAFVVGVDYEGNLVYGKTPNTPLGPKLRLMPNDAITSEADAQSVAENILYKSRLSIVRGQAEFPMECGLQLYDVIRLKDFTTNQWLADYRVGGFRSEYNNRPGIWKHTVVLVSV
jgi:hypothetical protein